MSQMFINLWKSELNSEIMVMMTWVTISVKGDLTTYFFVYLSQILSTNKLINHYSVNHQTIPPCPLSTHYH